MWQGYKSLLRLPFWTCVRGNLMRHNELHPFHNSEYTRCLPKEHRCCESNNCGYLANIDNLNQTTRKHTGFRGHLEAWMEAGCTRATLVRRDCGKPLYDGKEDVHKQQREQPTRRASSTETAGKKKEKKNMRQTILWRYVWQRAHNRKPIAL